MTETKDHLLVFIELIDGNLDETGKGLLALGSRLANVIGVPWSAATCSHLADRAALVFGSYGTPALTTLCGGERIFDCPAQVGHLLAQFARARNRRIIVLPHNDLGATIAPIVAVELGGAIVTEVTAISRDKGEIKLSRNTLGNKIVETRVWDFRHPLVITVPLSSLSTVVLPSIAGTQPTIEEWREGTICAGPTPMVVKRIPPDPKTVALNEAEIIFCAGKGCDREVFDQLRQLCQLLNVSLGVTRPVYDMGWAGFERMIGQTGKTVTPRLYLAFGVSGSMHHVGGIKDSRRIIALNIDAKAPIFPNADEGFVADLTEVLPLLLEKAKIPTEVTP